MLFHFFPLFVSSFFVNIKSFLSHKAQSRQGNRNIEELQHWTV